MTHQRWRTEWFGNIRGDLLAGLVTALALMPEVISFSILAGVDPKIGIYASFTMAVVIAIAGGRPAMISAAAGSMALVLVGLVKDHGVAYLLPVTVLTGIIQIVAGLLRLSSLMRFVSQSVMTGFVNALAILIFSAQLPELHGVSWVVYPMVLAGFAIIYLVPRLTTIVPSPLIAILVLTVISVIFGFDVRTVGDMGELPSSLPAIVFPDVPLDLETFRIILPYALTLAAVGILESMLTERIVDEVTDTPSDMHRETVGQGVANIATGFLGGMAGCAMIGQTIINLKSGGRQRLSTFSAGIFLLFLVVVAGDIVARIPMAALAAVMIVVAIDTFDWRSLRTLTTHPKSASLVMLATVVVVVATRNLAAGVLVGVVLNGLFFAWEVAHTIEVRALDPDATGTRTYVVSGQVFFVTADAFTQAFDLREDVTRVVIDTTGAHFWDVSAIGALEKVIAGFGRREIPVRVIGLNEASSRIATRLAPHLPTDPHVAHD